MGSLVVLFLTLFGFDLALPALRRKPGAMQQIAEMLLTNPMEIGIRDILDENGGRHGRSFIYVVGTIIAFSFYWRICLVVSVVLTAPTAHVTVPLGCAILIFLYLTFRRHSITAFRLST